MLCIYENFYVNKMYMILCSLVEFDVLTSMVLSCMHFCNSLIVTTIRSSFSQMWLTDVSLNLYLHEQHVEQDMLSLPEPWGLPGFWSSSCWLVFSFLSWLFVFQSFFHCIVSLVSTYDIDYSFCIYRLSFLWFTLLILNKEWII